MFWLSLTEKESLRTQLTSFDLFYQLRLSQDGSPLSQSRLQFLSQMLQSWLGTLYLFLRCHIEQPRKIAQTTKTIKMMVIAVYTEQQVASRSLWQSYLVLQLQELKSQQLQEPLGKKQSNPQMSPHDRVVGKMLLLSYRFELKMNHVIPEATMLNMQKHNELFWQLQFMIRLCYQQSNKYKINNLPQNQSSSSFIQLLTFFFVCFVLMLLDSQKHSKLIDHITPIQQRQLHKIKYYPSHLLSAYRTVVFLPSPISNALAVKQMPALQHQRFAIIVRFKTNRTDGLAVSNYKRISQDLADVIRVALLTTIDKRLLDCAMSNLVLMVVVIVIVLMVSIVSIIDVILLVGSPPPVTRLLTLTAKIDQSESAKSEKADCHSSLDLRVQIVLLSQASELVFAAVRTVISAASATIGRGIVAPTKIITTTLTKWDATAIGLTYFEGYPYNPRDKRNEDTHNQECFLATHDQIYYQQSNKIHNQQSTPK